MLVDPSNSAAGSRVTGAIRQAPQATGASFNYFLATAQVESGRDPQAGAQATPTRKSPADLGLHPFADPADLEAGP